MLGSKTRISEFWLVLGECFVGEGFDPFFTFFQSFFEGWRERGEFEAFGFGVGKFPLSLGALGGVSGPEG